jgi:hypothetical protein
METSEDRRNQRLQERRERMAEILKRRKSSRPIMRRVSMYGQLTVSGDGEIVIPIRGGKPQQAEASFIGDPPPPMGCGPVLPDELTVILEKVSRSPLWQLRLTWDIKSGGIRELEWGVKVLMAGKRLR